jgi:hypothetical protein
MNVGDLQKYLHDLSDFVEGGGGKKVADELRGLAGSLAPFAEKSLKLFGEHLAKFPEGGGGEARSRPIRTRVAKPDPAQVANDVRGLYDQVLDPSLTTEHIEERLRPLGALSKDGLKGVAAALQLPLASFSKLKVIEMQEAIRKTVLGRRAMHQRTAQ